MKKKVNKGKMETNLTSKNCVDDYQMMFKTMAVTPIIIYMCSLVCVEQYGCHVLYIYNYLSHKDQNSLGSIDPF